MVTGHDITTRIVNHLLVDLQIKYERRIQKHTPEVNLNTGGVMDVKESKEKYFEIVSPDWVGAIEGWRDYINDNYLLVECDSQEIHDIIKKICPMIYSELFRIKEEDKPNWLPIIYELISYIENASKVRGVLLKTSF